MSTQQQAVASGHQRSPLTTVTVNPRRPKNSATKMISNAAIQAPSTWSQPTANSSMVSPNRYPSPSAAAGRTPRTPRVKAGMATSSSGQNPYGCQLRPSAAPATNTTAKRGSMEACAGSSSSVGVPAARERVSDARGRDTDRAYPSLIAPLACVSARSSSARRRRDPDKRLRLVDEPAGGDGRHTGRQRSRIQPRQRSGSFQFATFHIPDGKTGQGSLLYGPRVIGKGCPVRSASRGVKSNDDAQPFARLPMPHGSPYGDPACERGHWGVRAERQGHPGALQSAPSVHRLRAARTETLLVQLAGLTPRRVKGWLHAGHHTQFSKGCDVGVGDHLDVLQAMPGRADASGPELRRRPPQT